jgi:hypothetical protein
LDSFYFQSNFIPAMIARKQNTHNTIGPEAPRNLKPSASNSIGPVAAFSNKTMQAAEIADSVTPIVAADGSRQETAYYSATMTEVTLTTIYEEAEEGGYIGYVAELPGANTQGRDSGRSAREPERSDSTNSGNKPGRI